MTDRLYAVDRLEGTSAILMDDAGDVVIVPLSRLPTRTAQGNILKVPVEHGTPDWGRSVIDSEDNAQRLAELRKRIEELRKGG